MDHGNGVSGPFQIIISEGTTLTVYNDGTEKNNQQESAGIGSENPGPPDQTSLGSHKYELLRSRQ